MVHLILSCIICCAFCSRILCSVLHHTELSSKIVCCVIKHQPSMSPYFTASKCRVNHCMSERSQIRNLPLADSHEHRLPQTIRYPAQYQIRDVDSTSLLPTPMGDDELPLPQWPAVELAALNLLSEGFASGFLLHQNV